MRIGLLRVVVDMYHTIPVPYTIVWKNKKIIKKIKNKSKDQKVNKKLRISYNIGLYWNYQV